MGEYADLYDEYSLNSELESSDDPEDIFDEWGIPTINTCYSCENDYIFPIESNFNYSKLNKSLLKNIFFSFMINLHGNNQEKFIQHKLWKK